MLDKAVQAAIRPLLVRAARGLCQLGVSADALTWTGFVLGLGAAAAIATGGFLTGLCLLLLSRLMDGLDGAVARATQPTDRGGFLDITLDFVFYASIPLAFAVVNPAANALAAAVLLASFIGTGSSFLAFAIVAEKRRLHSLAFPDKSFYFLGGLTEATETLIAFVAMCLWPQWFAPIAYGFAALCAVTTALRIGWGYTSFR
ncbi:MAG TPA: CDP-alcohol phosphatidyltransferase family protein [Hydrogenophaga sp.]|uniref:CDP-alcohol phosphatidyltransferase family protein n=1 Tax=Hydrogenophaga sp. TaxID=1904254 RepID=UPI002BDD966C|nr:CDP-alcohol phosphatidyltransferase family protein [Hydrogenophaga sp.]HMN94713.1 CDP-alcohol phosphatidyltransferase family protein [Hydrogenophaga sp.]HMP08925.1 CDP-alcohol phosphatidyltransferase family protein [Hydrogenophaga sp.]